jgi:uncharacterized YigZ family protein
MIDSYRTLAAPATARLTRKKSRFIADAFPVASPDDADRELATVRRRHHDASHHCYAYRLADDAGHISRSEDAGEPSGSAGSPILQQIEASELLNVLVVVTRYFGGTKLGIGGLVRAYGDAAREVLEAADIVERKLRVEVSIGFPIEVNSCVMATIHRHQADVQAIAYDECANARVSLPPSGVDRFCKAIIEATGNRARIEVKR